MSFFCVIVELRARAFQINMAALYPFHMIPRNQMFADSCGIIRIRPWTGVRLIYDCALFGIDPPPRTTNNSMVMEEIKDEDNKVISRQPYACHKYSIPKAEKVQGYPLKSYMPKIEKRRAQYVNWNFNHVAGQGEESAVAELKQAMKKNGNMFLGPHPDFTTGEVSWTWPPMPIAKQKMVQQQQIDPFNEYTARGAHMPLMVFIGEQNKTRRSSQARSERIEKATAKGGRSSTNQEHEMEHNRTDVGKQRWRSTEFK